MGEGQKGWENRTMTLAEAIELPAWVGELLQKLIVPAAEDAGLIGRDFSPILSR